jgi:hypothetical protein
MVSILKTDKIQASHGSTIEIPSGHVLNAPGHVIQVEQYTDTTAYTNSSTTVAQGPQTSTFTLKNSTSKVLVTVNCCMQSPRSSAAGGRLALYRGSIASGTKITSGAEPQFYTQNSGTEQYAIISMQFLDTPGVASTTYSMGFYKHPSATDAKIKGDFLTTTILLQEIAQ